MDFNEYQKKALTYDLFIGQEHTIDSRSFMSHLLGFVGETGEVADKVKKIYRDEGAILSEEKLELLKKELGDVLWHIAVLSSYLGVQMEDIATINVAKLQDRKDRGKISGSGDNR